MNTSLSIGRPDLCHCHVLSGDSLCNCTISGASLLAQYKGESERICWDQPPWAPVALTFPSHYGGQYPGTVPLVALSGYFVSVTAVTRTPGLSIDTAR